MGGEEDLEMGAPEGEEDVEALDEAGIYLEEESDIVQEVARRVAKRLLRGKSQSRTRRRSRR